MDITTYLKQAAEARASDLIVAGGSAISIKREGALYPLGDRKPTREELEGLVTQLYRLADRDMAPYLDSGDDDFAFALPDVARFRVNTYRQRGSCAAVIRIVPFHIPDWEQLNIPPQVMALSEVTSGLVLFTGPADSGKSTTQACIIDRINQNRACHIITLESPIEFLHRNRRSIISQREISIDTRDYNSGLRACLRQAPDVILLGEMRAAETIRTAMTAAETGHMVMATLHTGGAANSIDRIIDVFPAAQQAQIRLQLATVLHAVVSQQFLPDVNGDPIPAFELMHTNSAIRNLIREGKTHQLAAAIASSTAQGMFGMDQYILGLYREGKIDGDTAAAFAENPDQMKRRLSE